MRAGILVFVFGLLALVLIAVPSSLAVHEPDGQAAQTVASPDALPKDSTEGDPTDNITWAKTVDGLPWTPDLAITTQTTDTLWITETLDLLATDTPFDQVERWDPTHLTLLQSRATTGTLTLDPTGVLTWTGQVSVPATLTLTKQFRVLPCTWTTAVLTEELWLDGALLEQRPVAVHKLPPLLALDAQGASQAGGPVYPGQIVTVTLLYSNTGGYENDVEVRAAFPEDAPFLRSDPPADRVDALDGLWAHWDLGDLPQGAQGSIDVTFQVAADALPGSSLQVSGGLYDHVDQLGDEVLLAFSVAPPVTWTKTVDGLPWTPGLAITTQTTDTLWITDTLELLATGTPFDQVERWDPTHLTLLDSNATGGALTLDPTGALTWTGQVSVPATLTLTKQFRVLPCTWTTTVLTEELWLDGALLEERPVDVHKLPPLLALDAQGSGQGVSQGASPVYPGQIVTFTLLYSNTGGYENDVEVRAAFPEDAPFLRSDPPADRVDAVDGLWAHWDLGDLPQDTEGRIDVALQVVAYALPGSSLQVSGGIYDHIDQLGDEVLLTFPVAPPIAWIKTVDGLPWASGLAITTQTTDTFEVVETLQLLPPFAPTRAATAAVPSLEGPIPELPVTSNVQVFDLTPAVVALAYPDAALWDQINPPENFFASQDFESAFDAYDVYGADDFQNAEPWVIERITTQGGWATSAGLPIPVDLGNASALHWYIYPDNGDELDSEPAGVPGDGTEFWSLSLLPTDPQVDPVEASLGNALLTLNTPIYLPPGNWWLVFFPSLDFAPANTQYGWGGSTASVWGELGQQNNPGDVYGFGPGWTPNSYGADYSFRLEGQVTPLIFLQIERWDPNHLRLIDWFTSGEATDESIVTTTNSLTWGGEIDTSAAITLTKRFQVLPCTWTASELREELWVNEVLQEERVVGIQKMAPALRLDAEGGGTIYAGQPFSVTLIYGNDGGYETDGRLRAEFPPQAPFLRSDPPAQRADPAGLWAEWDVGDLAQNAEGTLLVTAQAASELRPPATVELWAGLYDHMGALQDEATVSFEAGIVPRWVYLPLVVKRFAP